MTTKTDLKTFIQPVIDLQDDARPKWGRMSARHMVEHLVLTVRLSNGKLEGRAAYEDKKLPVLKRFLESDNPMPRNFTNPLIGEELKLLMFGNLDEAKKKLVSEIDDFYRFFEENPEATPVNPTFGPLTFKEWLQFHWKHFTHHFTQFGLIEAQENH